MVCLMISDTDRCL